MFGLLKKHCPVCGMDVDKESSIKRFGKHFCSTEHAEQFSEKASERKDDSRDHGGCC